MSFDKTYCTAQCSNKSCELHYSKAIECICWKGFASYADRSKKCSAYRFSEKEKRDPILFREDS